MGLKYRIRVSADRVIGPFSKEDVAELFQKKHITGVEECQLFPVGDWKQIKEFPSLKEIFSAPIINIDQVKRTDQTQSSYQTGANKVFEEFKFTKEEQESVDYSALEKKYYVEPEVEKTRVMSRVTSDDLEKTRINTNFKNIPQKKEEQKSSIIESEEEVEPAQPIVVAPTREELVNEATQMMDLGNLLPTINTELRVSEIQIEQQEQIEENQDKIKFKKSTNENSDTSEINTKKKGMKPIVAIAFLALIYVLLTPDEAPVVKEPIYSKIVFPITQEFEDASKASLALSKGREAMKANTYKSKLLASQYFVDSLQNQFNNNPAMGELILTYSELMDSSKDEKTSSNVIYKLISLSENKSFTDTQTVVGSSLFYLKIGKSQTGINLIKNFFRAKGKVSHKLLSYYLELLLSASDLTEAAKIALKLNEIQPKPPEAILALTKFYELDEKPELAEKILDEGLKKSPNSVPLLLRRAEFFLKANSFAKLEELLKKTDDLNAEFSPLYFAKHYKLMGFLAAVKNKNKEAAVYFKKSLAIMENIELRSVLASLEIKGDKFAQALILESKIIALMKKVDAEIKNKNMEAAATFSIEAVDADPDYVPALLQHVHIQLERGLYEAAIHSLTKIIDKHPSNTQVKKILIETYISVKKFDDAQKMLIELARTKFAFTSEYARLMGNFFAGRKSNVLMIRWYTEALKRNPLSDPDMYSLARVYFNLKKFDEAKKHLVKALTLDPKNVEYISLQAEILYDQDSADVAIGYLRDIIADVGEDPLLISNIAKFYYKSRQLKEFQNYYKKISSMPKKNEKFFEFLIYASRLDDNKEDAIKYTNELLKISPSNIGLQMELAEQYLAANKKADALIHLRQIEEKLASYPRLNYLLSKMAVLDGDFPRAKELAEKEKNYNPTLELGYIMLGEVAMARKDYREAIPYFEKAISINPKSVEALLPIASIKLAQNHASEALDIMLQAEKLDKNNPEIAKQLGFAYRASGQRTQAREKFEDYLKLNPGASDRELIEGQIRALK